MLITINGMKTKRGGNNREHHFARHKRVKAEKEQVAWMLIARGCTRPKLPAVITLTRIAPSNGLDDDNLAGALKSVRDAVAAWADVDDRHKHIIKYEYDQRRGPWGVEISWPDA